MSLPVSQPATDVPGTVRPDPAPQAATA